MTTKDLLGYIQGYLTDIQWEIWDFCTEKDNDVLEDDNKTIVNNISANVFILHHYVDSLLADMEKDEDD